MCDDGALTIHKIFLDPIQNDVAAKIAWKGDSAAAGATVSDKIWLKHSFVHCSVPEVVNLSMAIFFLECVMMVPSPFIKSCQAVDDLWVSLDSAGVPKLRRDYIQKFSCMSLYVYRVRKTMREIFIEERMTRLEWWDDTNSAICKVVLVHRTFLESF